MILRSITSHENSLTALKPPRSKFALVASLFIFTQLPSAAVAEVAMAHDALESLRAELEVNRIIRVEIFFVPYEKFTRVRMTPDLLERQADKKFTLALSKEQTEGLITALRDTVLSETKPDPDLRWGAKFTVMSSIKSHSIYLSGRSIFGRGRQGYVDGAKVGLNGSLVQWFETNFQSGFLK